MEIEHVSIDIEGDYLSSFIYSGVLILVDSDFVLHAYSWDDIVSVALRSAGVLERNYMFEYLKNSSTSRIPSQGRGKRYFIGWEELTDCHKKIIHIGVWPSDLNIYKNRIYISSDEGVDIVDFDWRDGRVSSFSDPKKIWAETAFALSTNNYFRLAIASGKSGVLSFIPKNREIAEHDIFQLVASTCVDCDWQGERLIANTSDGVNLIDFKSIPAKTEFKGTDTEYWSAVNSIKREPPQINKLETLGERRIVSSWLAGEKLFFLTKDMEIGFVLQGHTDFADVQGNFNIRPIGKCGSVLASRTASFGTVIEIDNSLNVLGRNSIHAVDEDFATWRVFPRSKNYANQLHIIKETHLSILAVESPNDEQSIGGYGFAVESVRKSE